MTPQESGVLARVRELAWAGRVRLTGHAMQRMEERGVSFEDVRHALVTATTCSEVSGERWKLTGGLDCDGDELTAIAVIELDVVVITLY